MISGFTLPLNEFHTPYRVINYHVCNGCWTDSSEEFVHADFAWCPRHENTPREFECTRFISAGQVEQTINRLMQDYHLDPHRQVLETEPETEAAEKKSMDKATTDKKTTVKETTDKKTTAKNTAKKIKGANQDE
jgi:hypothetical protein